MSMLKRGIPLLLVIAVLLTSITGCGGNQQANQEGTKKEQAKTEELVQKSPVKFYMRTNVGRESKPDNQKVLDFIQKSSGIKLEITAISNDGYKDKIDLMIAANEEFDGMSLVGYGQDYSQLLDKNAIIPVNDLLDKYGPNVKKVMADGLYVGTDKEGKIWSLPRAEKFPEGYVPSIRTDWLKKLNMKMPETLKDIEAYLEAVKTKDPNGNGKNDEIPFLGDEFLYGFSNFIPYFMGATASSMSVNSKTIEKYLDKNGKVMPIYAHPNFKSMLSVFRDWYAKGYINKEAHVLKTTQINDLKSADRVGMTAGWYSTGIRAALTIAEKNPGAQYDPIPPLKDAPVISAWPSNPKYGSQTVFMKTSKNAPFLMKYFDWMLSSPDNLAVAQFGLEGEHWKWTDKAKNEMELIGNATEKYDQYYSLANLFFKTMPTVKISPSNKLDFEYERHMAIIRGFKMLYPFDSQIPYKVKGTAAENLTADGITLLNENIIKIIIGEAGLDTWDKVIDSYMKLEGNIRTDVWTKQYNEFVKK